MMWPFVKRAVDRGVEQGVRQAVDEYCAPGGGLDKAIQKILSEPRYTWFRFVKAMQARMMQVDPKMDRKLAFDTAMRVYLDFLREEKIEFGNPDYDWTSDGAVDLINEWEIDHWESAA